MITQEQARGDSIGLTRADYEKHVEAGKAALKSYLFPVSEFMRDGAWQSVQKEWGGVTIDTRSQWPVEPEFGYALKACGSPFDWNTLSIPISVLTDYPAEYGRERFNAMYALAISRFAGAPYIGIFRDDDAGLVEFDAVVIVATEQEARDIATLCEGVGGAYSFETGNGVFPYHVVRCDHENKHVGRTCPEVSTANTMSGACKCCYRNPAVTADGLCQDCADQADRADASRKPNESLRRKQTRERIEHAIGTNWRDSHPHEHTDGYPEHGHSANWNPAAHPEHKRDSNSIPSDADWFINPEFS